MKNVFAGYEDVLELTEVEKKAVPYVMECIELLFISYFENTGDLSCAKDACKIYGFVRKEKEKIWEATGVRC